MEEEYFPELHFLKFKLEKISCFHRLIIEDLKGGKEIDINELNDCIEEEKRLEEKINTLQKTKN